MLSSIGGHNERWAQIAALPPPPSQPGQDGGVGPGDIGISPTDVPPIAAIAGSTAAPLSHDTGFLLAVLGGVGHPGNPTGLPGSTAGPVQDQTTEQAQQQAKAVLGADNAAENEASDGIMGTSLVQELQALVSLDATITIASGGTAAAPAMRGGSAAGVGMTENSDTAAPSWRNGWDGPPSAADGPRQQVGLAA